MFGLLLALSTMADSVVHRVHALSCPPAAPGVRIGETTVRTRGIVCLRRSRGNASTAAVRTAEALDPARPLGASRPPALA